MSTIARVRTTIPPRTYGSGRKAKTPSAILLRMSFLELERQRRVQETEQLAMRTIKLQTRIEEIDREKLALRQQLDQTVDPLSSAGTVPVTQSGIRSDGASRPRGGFAIRY